MPDDKGNLLLGTSGILSLTGGHNAKSKLAYEKLVHSADQSDFVGFPTSSCDYVTGIAMWLDQSGASLPLPVMKTYWWSQSGPEDAAQLGSTVSDSGLAQISNNGSGDMVTFTPPDDGQTHSVTIGPPFPDEDVAFCDACSAGEVFVSAISSINIRIARAVYQLAVVGSPCSTYNLNCPNGNQNSTCGTAHLLGCGHNEPWATEFTVVVNGGSCFFANLVLFNAGPPGPCD